MVIDYSRQAGRTITTKGYRKKIVIIEDIKYIICEDHLSSIYLNSEKVISEIKTLCEFERQLCVFGFFRIRKNILINGRYITEIDSRINKRVVKLGEIYFIVSKNRLKPFLNWIS
ncbi:MAG: LytTR family transcriptional regulator DNA-binding domain-containing protein [Bacteroidales bacterium]|jgi:DNA-binding LytR/AlgR family response regulator|nr:LytTR family transcriptional regulator DNA-binding domain-containing protein [Bacteroidales bacterium]